MGDAAAQDGNGALQGVGLALPLHGGRPARLGLHLSGAHLPGQGLGLGIEPLLLPLLLLLLPEGLLTGGVGLDGGGAHPLQLLQPEGDLQPAHLIPQEQKAPGFFRLLAEGPHLELQLIDLVPDAHQVLLGPLQAALGLLLPVAEAGDARGLLKDLPAVGALDREDLVDLALADDGVALPSQSGVHEELVHVPEADGAAVDVIFALPGAVVAAGHHDLVLRQGEGVVPVI